MTCKLKTQPDLLFLSPELQHCLVDIEIIQDLFADHAVVIGHFTGMRSQTPRSFWRMPQHPAWQSALGSKPFEATLPSGADTTCPSSWYAGIFARFEAELAKQPNTQNRPNKVLFRRLIVGVLTPCTSRFDLTRYLPFEESEWR